MPPDRVYSAVNVSAVPCVWRESGDEKCYKVKLPEVDQAEVPETKIVDYLLSPTHRSGKSKAAFFAKHGFTAEHWQVLAGALRMHAIQNEISSSGQSAFGKRFVVDGPLAAPDGSALNVRSVWFISRGTSIPRFATAHPLKRKTA